MFILVDITIIKFKLIHNESKNLILTPVYNDWENLNKLLVKINKIFQNEVENKV